MSAPTLGVLSGTSIDAVDAALVGFDGGPRLIATHSLEIPADLKADLRRLCTPGPDEIDLLGRADVAVGRLFAEAVNGLVAKAGLAPRSIGAIGSHGQTVRHRPGLTPPFTLQIGDPNTIAALTGIPVVADFRRKDMALGGQGAPLVPAFHAGLFRSAEKDRLIANLGGIANVTVLPANPAARVRGYDTGPANTLLDLWARRTLGTPWDADGALAASGQVHAGLLAALLADPFFAQPPPKSTGPEYFSEAWLTKHLASFAPLPPADVQATLAQLTARSLADAVRAAGLREPDVFVCGGGARNPDLMRRIAVELPGSRVGTTDDQGVPAAWVEAMAFAWLAHRHLEGLPGNLPDVTGASRPAVLGGWYPA